LEPLPDLGSLSDEELKKLIEALQDREREVSYERRILHGKIDILRAELVERLKQSGGKSVLNQGDLSKLTDILTGKVTPEA
jgi:anti-sigma-K factor RsiG